MLPKDMITQQGADEVSDTLEASVVDDSTSNAESVDSVDDDISSQACDQPPPQQHSRRNLLITLAAFLLTGQWMIYTSLKHHIIVPDNIIPQLQQQFNNLNETMLLWSRFNQSVSSRTNLTQERSRPGYQLAREGAHMKYPIVMIPGFVTSGLEVWEGKECGKKYFRQRMWGGVGSVQQWLMERQCVLQHLTLDPVTGVDPEGIRIRAAQGFEAADYFMGNYWVWGKILESLADVGYDGSSMSMESYDWRLSFPKLEERDGFFTKLKYKIEAFHKVTGKKIVLTSHSLGVLLVHYFFAWVSNEDPFWVDNHIHAHINIAGAHLGVPKAASALLSGEVSDTIFMGAVGSLLEQFIGRKVRCDLWRSWSSLWHMLPKGSDDFWNRIMTMTDGEGNLDSTTNAKDEDWDVDKKTPASEAVEQFGSFSHHPSSRVIDLLTRIGGGYQVEREKTVWHDASTTPLPKAPNMKVYCLYGVGIETERAYYYKRNYEENSDGELSPSADLPFVIDTNYEDLDKNIRHGIEYADGDGSVPIESLGYLCTDAWRRPATGLNPSRIPVVTREYEHREEFLVEDPMRGGPHSGDHVDILGHNDVLADLIRIVTDHEIDEVKDNIISNIKEVSNMINARGGVRGRIRIKKTLKKWQARARRAHAKVKAIEPLNRLKKIRLLFRKLDHASQDESINVA